MTSNSMPDQSRPGIPTTGSPSFVQGGGGKLATEHSHPHKIHNEMITIGHWNASSLFAAGKLEELVNEVKLYRWAISGLSEVRWTSIGELKTTGDHKLYYSGHKRLHIRGIGFLVNIDYAKSLTECRSLSDRITTLRLKASPKI